MFDELFSLPSSIASPVPIEEAPVLVVQDLVPAVTALVPDKSTGLPSSTFVDQVASSASTSQTPPEKPSPVIPKSVEEVDHDIEVAHMDNTPYLDLPIPEPNSN
uniref:Uncharacterized protein n=1 Tax=Tanacetum cinerariifolium TaxID=118510 RepID=A0A699WFK3_TANCI|nr:hypothetical protein [Tanacetum cinerariifolium]